MTVAIIIFAFLLLLFALFLFLHLFFRGAPFAVTSPTNLKTIIELAKIKPGEKAVDLGAGDGRLVIALAQAGAETHGYEINPLLAWLARRNLQKAGLTKKAFIHRQNFWQVDLSQFDVITIFGIGYIMAPLAQKLKKELKPSARVISNGYPLPTWPITRQIGEIYLYKNPGAAERI